MIFQLLRSRSHQFRTRSSQRDSADDRRRLDHIELAIKNAIEALNAEREGLDRRVKAATSLAAIAVGTAADEYIDRDPSQELSLRQFETELKNGNNRIARLDEILDGLSFLRVALYERFPELKLAVPPTSV